MALVYTFNPTSIENAIETITTFASDNGWTIDTGTSTLLVMSKSGVTHTVEKYDSATAYLRTTVGGLTSPSVNCYRFFVSTTYSITLISCGTSMYFCHSYSTGITGFFAINDEDKVGDWTGGNIVSGGIGSVDMFFGTSTNAKNAILKNGVWRNKSGTNLSEGDLTASFDYPYTLKGPNYFNGAVIPIPIMVYQANASTGYKHPIGTIDTMFQYASIDTVYKDGDIFTIGSDQYYFMKQMVYNRAYGALFKVS